MIKGISNNRKSAMTNIVHAALLGVGIVLVAGCTSTSEDFQTGLKAGFTTTDQRSTLKDEARYVPPQSPGFH
jgi:hypothetical protein